MAFVRLACPSHLHRPATSLRFAPLRACCWGSAWSAPANSSRDESHHRTASGHCSLGVNRFGRTHTSSGASYRERNRSHKHPERTNGTPRFVSVFVPSHEAFGAQSRMDHASERNASEARSSDSVRSTVLSSVRQKPTGTRERNAGSKNPSTEHQWVINQASTERQPSVNETSTKRQRNVNRSSTKRQRNIKSTTFSTRTEKTLLGRPSTDRAAWFG